MTISSLPRLIQRLGLGFCFLSFGIWEIAAPDYWIGYLPSFVMHLSDPLVLVRLHGIALAAIGAALVAGILPRLTSALAGLMMLEIIIFLAIEEGWNEILVRDVAILTLAVSLFVGSMPAKDAPPKA